MGHINMTSHTELSKLRWQCRRGVKELDVVLCRYLENSYQKNTTENQQTFKTLLTLEDPLLLSWLMGDQVPQDSRYLTIINEINLC